MADQYFYPNVWGRLMLEGFEQTIGADGLQKILKKAGLEQYIAEPPANDNKKAYPFAHVSALFKAAFDLYDRDEFRRVTKLVGAHSQVAGRSRFSDLLMAMRPALYGGSLEKKLKMGLEIYARLFMMLSDQKIEVDSDETYWYWRVTRCPICWEWDAGEAVCDMIIGNLHEATRWVSGGPEYEMEETECVARGDQNCTVRIRKQPIRDSS